MPNTSRRTVIAILFAASFAGAADLPPAAGILEAHCLRCHNESVRMSGLSLVSAADAAKGGLHGPAIVPGKPDESNLVRMISGEKPKMPMQAAPLTGAQVAEIRAWIAQGALWPEDLRADRNKTMLWSLQPLRKPAVPPAASKWARTPIDAFVLAKLSEKKLTPSPEADAATLIRRLTYDLHGLPPAWEEIQAFVGDKSPDAYEKLVDRLLASPRYGERWGRHWLDVVHYGESHGYDKDKPRRNAWPYRDYVIRAFNQDKPYARFVEEQLAGDVLWPDDPDGTVATGFIAAGPWDYVGQVELREGTTDKNITRLLDRDDMVMTTMSAFVSMTAHCARCHNHKFDPIPQEDYYRLQAVFAGVDRADVPYDLDPKVHAARRPLLEKRRVLLVQLRPLQEQAASVTSPELKKLDETLTEVKFEFAQTQKAELQPQIAKLTADRKALWQALVSPETHQQIARLSAAVQAIERDLDRLGKPQLVYAAANAFDPQGTFTFAVEPRAIAVLQRGSVESPGKLVGPGALSCVPSLESRFRVKDGEPEGARRAALAHWITAPDNMLTWRSIVNRVWQYHFGSGIVDSANDFGHMGSEPTHPELLDWLAVTFRDGGGSNQSGSIKRLQKLILMSATYRQRSANNPANAQADSENRYLWRMNRQRLDAESVRDAVLSVSGKLDVTMGGPSAEQFWFKDDHSPTYDYSRFDIDSPASYRRSVYRFLVRSVPDPFMDSLDCPDASLITAKRNTTITAIQALAQLNNPFMVRQAEHLAARVTHLAAQRDQQIAWLYRLTLGRNPDGRETRRLADFAAQQGLENAARAMLNTSEFLFVD
ncbi:MAG TPA: PSD1 and planctomycete cytochrome C domain-containing protein [Candidatus Acidoferrales bacterium]|nr:PSD1 and planctomycete cytochrome C domain-containing protein [Candidatus Acidoferrales bacterium]